MIRSPDSVKNHYFGKNYRIFVFIFKIPNLVNPANPLECENDFFERPDFMKSSEDLKCFFDEKDLAPISTPILAPPPKRQKMDFSQSASIPDSGVGSMVQTNDEKCSFDEDDEKSDEFSDDDFDQLCSQYL